MQNSETEGDVITPNAFRSLDKFLKNSVPGVFPAGVVLVMQGGAILFHKAYGFLDPGQNLYPILLQYLWRFLYLF